jgi:pimeloyl-ACP methyl ester carboxylesterase
MVGAGFYLTATDPKWRKHYNMYDLVVKELPAVLKEADLGLDTSRMSIMGHSMGGTSTEETELTTGHGTSLHQHSRQLATPP